MNISKIWVFHAYSRLIGLGSLCNPTFKQLWIWNCKLFILYIHGCILEVSNYIGPASWKSSWHHRTLVWWWLCILIKLFTEVDCVYINQVISTNWWFIFIWLFNGLATVLSNYVVVELHLLIRMYIRQVIQADCIYLSSYFFKLMV